MQFLPHDTFEYDVRRQKTSSEIIRYKVSFIQEIDNGSWKEIKIARRLGRSRSLSSRDVAEVATQTFALAARLGRKVQVMWFCAIPESLGIGRNLPWVRAPSADLSLARSIAPARPRFKIQTRSDLAKAERLDQNQFVLVLQPNIDLIRDDQKFLEKLAEVALKVGAPVELRGSVLGHAYYMLQRSGVTVVAAGETQYSRVRGRQIFAKLVRDEIPRQIEQHGETTDRLRLATSTRSTRHGLGAA